MLLLGLIYLMSKRAELEKRSVTLVLICLTLVSVVSVLSVFVTNEFVSAIWVKFGASLSTAKEYVGRRIPSSPGVPPPSQPWQHDDPTCLSRTQQFLYRNPNHNRATPPNLTIAWNSYTRMHKACFRRNWTEVFLSRNSFDQQPHGDTCQYLVYIEGREGLGNGILSLASAFMFAMATNRVLLVDNRKNIPKLLCEPFPESSWRLPADFPYQDLLNSSSLGTFMHEGGNASTVSLNLQHTLNAQDQQIFCEEAYASLRNVKWVAWTSNQYFLTNFFLLPSFWERIHPIFGDDIDHLFTYISRLLFLPDNNTWAIILREYWSYMSGAMSRLGVQVRLHGRPNLAEYDTEANDKVMKCLVQNDLLPSFSDGNNITELLTLYNTKMNEGENESKADIVVLVASLQGRYAETLKDNFGLVPTKGTKMVRVHTVSHQGAQNTGFHQAQLAFVEMWLLSFSDHLATSAFSTFGYIAQGLAGSEPLILVLKKGEDDKSCVLGQSIEPCNHYPQKPVRCLGADAKLSDKHKGWIRTHLRQCQDHTRGWQLVHGGVEGNPVAFDFL